MKEYQGPNVYRVMDVHPAAEIEFSGEEIEAMLNALGYIRMQFQNAPQPEGDVLADVMNRLYRARTAILTQHGTIEGERKRYAQ